MSVNPFQPYGGQTTYTVNTANAMPGTLADIGFNTIRSYVSQQAIGFGLGLAQGKLKGSYARLPQVNSVALTESMAMVASNSTVGNVNVTTFVNGVPTTVTTAIGPVVFATSDAATLTAIAAAIAAVSGVASANVAGSTITVAASPDQEVTLSGFTTTLGASQPLWTTVNSSTDTLIGASLFEQTIENDLVLGTAIYPVGKALNVLTLGRLYVTCETTCNPGDPVYVRFQVGSPGTVKGAFRNNSDSGKCLQLTRARWVDTVAAGAVGVLEIALP